MIKLMMNAKELAEALGMPLSTVQQYASKRPETLPPRMKLATRKLMWSVKDVEAWIHTHRGSQSIPTASVVCADVVVRAAIAPYTSESLT